MCVIIVVPITLKDQFECLWIKIELGKRTTAETAPSATNNTARMRVGDIAKIFRLCKFSNGKGVYSRATP